MSRDIFSEEDFDLYRLHISLASCVIKYPLNVPHDIKHSRHMMMTMQYIF